MAGGNIYFNFLRFTHYGHLYIFVFAVVACSNVCNQNYERYILIIIHWFTL